MIKNIMERRENTELTAERTETLERKLALGPKLNRERDDPYADMI